MTNYEQMIDDARNTAMNVLAQINPRDRRGMDGDEILTAQWGEAYDYGSARHALVADEIDRLLQCERIIARDP